MRYPTIHLNGSNPEALLADLTAAHLAAKALLDALGACTPHGRDYYPQGPSALTEALKEHWTHMEQAAAVAAYLAALRRQVRQAVVARKVQQGNPDPEADLPE